MLDAAVTVNLAPINLGTGSRPRDGSAVDLLAHVLCVGRQRAVAAADPHRPERAGVAQQHRAVGVLPPTVQVYQ